MFQYVADAKAPYKHLAGGIAFIDVIPKNPSGKLLRRLLKDKVRRDWQKFFEEANAWRTRL